MTQAAGVKQQTLLSLATSIPDDGRRNSFQKTMVIT
jgi:hypothetical protein